MNIKGFKILIASPPDREKLVAEIWFEEKLIAEINQENGNLEIEIYAVENFKLPLKTFLEVMEKAGRHLLGEKL